MLKVMDYIHERVRDLEAGIALDVDKEVEEVRKKYREVRQAMENNEPDSYVHQEKNQDDREAKPS